MKFIPTFYSLGQSKFIKYFFGPYMKFNPTFYSLGQTQCKSAQQIIHTKYWKVVILHVQILSAPKLGHGEPAPTQLPSPI
jgi:hypothetical protein